MSPPPSQTISPPIFYWGTPIVLVMTENEDGSTNIAPMSSAWWLGNRCMLGLASISQTAVNLRRDKQCVLNLASETMTDSINALAKTTGAKLTPVASELVRPRRIAECPAQMEAELVGAHEMMKDTGTKAIIAFEVKVLRIYVHEDIRMKGHLNRIDPDKWRPLIMSFQEMYGLSSKKTSGSRLAEIDEEKYRLLSNPLEDEGLSQDEQDAVR